MSEGLNVDDYSLNSDEDYNSSVQLTIQQREREEMEFFTDLAVQEMQRWIEAVTRKRFRYPDNPKTSLADGVQLCQLLNCIVPGSVKRINKLPTAMAGIDNLNVFINTCKTVFHLKQAQLFSPFDLQDKLNTVEDRNENVSPDEIKERADRKLRDVAITIFWLARQVQGIYEGPVLDFNNFTALVNAKALNNTSRSTVSDDLNDTRSSSIHSRDSSRDSLDNELREGGMRDEYKPHRQRGLSSSSFDSTEALEHHGRTQSTSSSNAGRRTSSSALVDPLQFITSKPAERLAHKAREQLELAKETKKTRVNTENDDTEWRMDLSSWKSLRKRKSSGGITLDREANQLIDPNEPVDYSSERLSTRRHTYQELVRNTSTSDDDVITFKTIQTTETEPQSTDEFLPVIESRETSVDREFSPLTRAAPSEFQIPDINTCTGRGADNSELGADNSELGADNSELGAVNSELGDDRGLSVDSSEGSESEEDDPLIKLLERAKIQTDEQREQRAEMGICNKRLTMTAAPTSDESYGFVIRGGKDKCCPITVETVASDSISSVAGLVEGDEIIEINKEIVTDRNRGYCMLLINGSLQSDGVLELYIKRDNSIKKDPTPATKETGLNSTAGKRTLNSTSEVKSLFDHYTKPADLTDGTKSSKIKSADKDDLDDQIAMERHYRSILDGGYESGVSTLRSEDVGNYKQLHVESTDSPSGGSIENSSSQDFVSPTADPVIESSNTIQQEPIERRVSRDFDEVFAQPKKNSLRIEKRSVKLNENFNERMREWQQEQDRLHQAELEENQKRFAVQINEYRTEAEKKERIRVEQIPAEEESMNTETVNRLKTLGKVHEKEVREKAVNRLKEIQERYSTDREQENNNTLKLHNQEIITPQLIQVHRVETVQHNPPTFDNHAYKEPEPAGGHQNYELTEREKLLREKEEEIRRMTAQLQIEQKKLAEEQKRIKEAATQPKPQEPVKTTPNINDVYRYYEDDLPSNLGVRDPSPPPMSRQDVLKINKQTVPVVTATRQNAVREPSPEPVKVTMRNKEPSSSAPWQRAKNNQHLQDRRKSAPSRPANWMNENRAADYEIPEKQSSIRTSSSDIDPNLPSTLSKDDVLKMTREKARYGGGIRRKSAVTPTASVPAVKEEPAVKSTRGFFSNRAMFEQQAQQAEMEWEKRQVELHKPKKPFPKQFTMNAEKRAPQLQRENRSKSVDVRSFRPPAPANTEGVVRGQDVNAAADERMREIQMMKNLREEEVRKAEQDERDRRLAEKKIRDDRQRELAAIRQMNRDYELQNGSEPYYRDDRAGPAPLEDARTRMGREAEELSRHQMQHDRENREIHGRQPNYRLSQRESVSSSDDSTTIQKEMEQIEKLGFTDGAKYKRHHEMIEQKQREEARRAESDKLRSQPRQASQEVTRQLTREPIRQPPALHPIHQQSAEINSKTYDQPRYNDYNPSTRSQPKTFQQPPRGFEDKPASTGPAPWERDHRQTAVVKNGSTYSPYSDRSSKLSPHSNPGSYSHHHQGSAQSTQSDFSETERLNNYSPKQVSQSQPSHPNNQSQRRFSPVNQSQPSTHVNQSKPSYQTDRGFVPNKDSYLQSQSIKSNDDRVYTPPPQQTPEKFAPNKPPRNEQAQDEPITVSAKYTCTYCNKELGKGAAMIIESLSLYYHIECFRCCVCTTLLSDGQMGADVRVRGNRLHCKNCYSNDDGLKLAEARVAHLAEVRVAHLAVLKWV